MKQAILNYLNTIRFIPILDTEQLADDLIVVIETVLKES
jgi:hypothetical protein